MDEKESKLIGLIEQKDNTYKKKYYCINKVLDVFLFYDNNLAEFPFQSLDIITCQQEWCCQTRETKNK